MKESPNPFNYIYARFMVGMKKNSLELLLNRPTAESSQLVWMIMKSNSLNFFLLPNERKNWHRSGNGRGKKMNWDQKIYSNGKFEISKLKMKKRKILAHNFKLKQTLAFKITSKSLSTDSATNHNLVVIFLLSHALSISLFFWIPNFKSK